MAKVVKPEDAATQAASFLARWIEDGLFVYYRLK